MEIEGDITRQDLADFNWYLYYCTPGIKRQRKIIITAGVLWSGVLLLAVVVGRSPVTLANAPYIASGLLGSGLLLLLMRCYFVQSLKKILAEAESKGMVGMQKLILSPQGIINIDKLLGEQVYAWTVVEHILTADTCSYIFVGKLIAFIVPRRFFPNDSAYTDFLNKVREYKAQVTSP